MSSAEESGGFAFSRKETRRFKSALLKLFEGFAKAMRDAAHARRLVLALLQQSRLQSLGTRGDRAIRDPMGTGGVERYAAPIGALLEVRPQGRDDCPGELG